MVINANMIWVMVYPENWTSFLELNILFEPEL